MHRATKSAGRRARSARLRGVTGALVVSIVLAGVFGVPVQAQAAVSYPIIATIGVGDGPVGAAVDPLSHTAYTANNFDHTVSVIDEATNTVTATIGVGTSPDAVAVDPVRHTVYVTNAGDGSSAGTVSVIAEASDTVTATIGVGVEPDGVAVDPVSHTVYVTNAGDGSSAGTVSVIAEASDTVTATVDVGAAPGGVAVDPVTHTVYVTNAGDGTTDGIVSVIAEASHAVTATIGVGVLPLAVALDPMTHTVYVTNAGDGSSAGTVSVIAEASDTVTATIGVGLFPLSIAVDPGTDTVYVVNANDNTESVIDTTTDTVTATIDAGSQPLAVAVDAGSHTVYVTWDLYELSVIDPLQSQTVVFTSTAPGPTAAGGSYLVTATGGGSGNPVTFTIDASATPGACTVADHGDSTGTVSFTGAVGTCVIDADQAAAPGYGAAPQAQQTITVVPAAPDHLALSPRSATITAGGAHTYSALAYDRYGNLVHDATADTTFQISPDGTCTANSCSATTAGPHTVTGTASSATGTATLTVNPAAAATIIPTAGSGQSAPPGTAYATRLTATLTDRYDNPIPDTKLTFTVTSGTAAFPGSGSGATTVSVDTNNSGTATAPKLTAGTTPGPVTVTATSGAATATFAETVTTPGPATADLTITLTGPSAARVGTTITLNAVVTNRGPSPAATILTTVAIPCGFSITSTGGGTRHGSTVLYKLASGLNAHTAHTYTITLTPTRPTTATFRASTVSVTADPDYLNNTTSATIHITKNRGRE